MAQHDFVISNQGFPAFRSDLNNFLQAVATTHSGTSLPSGAVAGTIWLDTTSATVPILKYYDGADNITLATINHTANTVDFADSSVVITGLSSTATGTVLTLTDTVSTSTVNIVIDNQKEVRFRETTANGTNYVALKAPASLASDLTFTLPSAHGTANQALITNGSGGVLSFATVSGGIEWQSVHSSSTLTAVAGYGYFLNTTSNAITVTLPASPSAGNQIALVDYAGTFDTNNLTINPNGNKIEGGTSNVILTGEREGVLLVYADSTQGWLATSGINEGTDALAPAPYTVDFLVVAGGGAGGNAFGFGISSSGAGGAGGYRNSYSTETSGGGGSSEASLSFTQGVVYTVTVGAGAGTNSTNNAQGGNGNDSSISGTGISTITSTGGGGGGGTTVSPGSTAGKNGGSGGGSTDSNATVGNGTANQGFNGGVGSASGAGGGGGAGAVGATSSTTTGGNGGNGLASSITGSSVTRGGGGGGSGGGAGGGGGTKGTGGTGGGGDGAESTSTSATAGSINTGSGGGGGNADDSISAGGAGGSGVVILRMPTANYSGTTTGSPTVTTDGSDKVIVFNASGSITG